MRIRFWRKMKTSMVGLLCLALLGSGLLGLVPEDTARADETSKLSASSATVALTGVIRGDASPSDTFTITNDDTETHDISMTASGDTSVIYLTDDASAFSLTAGSGKTFTAKANTGNAVGNYSVTYTFKDTSNAVNTVSVKVTFSILPTGVVINPASISLIAGNSQTFTSSVQNVASPGACTWSVSGNKDAGTTINSSGVLSVAAGETASAITVTASYAGGYSGSVTVYVGSTTYNIGVTTSGGGTVAGSCTVVSGGSATITAAPDNGNRFIGWYLNGTCVSTSARYTISGVSASATYEAKFSKASVHIKTKKTYSEAGHITKSFDADYGTNVEVKAEDKIGYRFDGWRENGKLLTSHHKLKLYSVKEDRTLTAVYVKKNYAVTLTVSPAGAGNTTGQGTHDIHRNINISAIPNPGYAFVCWQANGNTVTNAADYTIKDLSSHWNLTAVFTPTGAAAAQPAATPAPAAAPASSPKAVTSTSGSKKKDTSKDQKKDAAEDEEDAADELTEEEKEALDESGVAAGSLLERRKLTVEQARAKIAARDDEQLLKDSYEEGVLDLHVHNEMIKSTGQAEIDYWKDSGILNLSSVIHDVLTEDEEIALFQGKPVSMHVNVYNADISVSDADRNAFESYKGSSLEIGNYFDLVLMKTVNGVTTEVSELPTGMRVTIAVPPALRNTTEVRTYYVIREHVYPDGTVLMSTLNDEDMDDTTVTFTTDKFSTYALAYGVTAAKVSAPQSLNYVLFGVIGALVLIILMLLCRILLKSDDMGRRDRFDMEDDDYEEDDDEESAPRPRQRKNRLNDRKSGRGRRKF